MPKRVLQGVVVSDKQDKTVVVRVARRFTHPEMKKTVRSTKKYYAHDETNQYEVDDIAWIEERRPLSKLKRWEVVRGEKKMVFCSQCARKSRGRGWRHDSDADQPRRGG